MHARAPRGPFVRHWRRLRVRWRAYRTPAGGAGFVFPPPLLEGVSAEQQQRAVEHACRMLGGEMRGDLRSSVMRRSVGLQLCMPDGTASWLKISRPEDALRKLTLPRERNAQTLSGVPMPAILREIDWRGDGISWHAFQFSLAPSPAVERTPWMGESARPLADDWIAQLRRAIDALSASPLAQWLIHPGAIARTIAQRFGRKAPYQVDEWRMAHGDLNWGNITAPKLVLLDWESWGVAPRGFDVAMLLSLTILNPELYRRIEQAFIDDLDTPSGVVSRLYLLARRLNRIEAGFRDPREHRPLEAETKRLLRM